MGIRYSGRRVVRRQLLITTATGTVTVDPNTLAAVAPVGKAVKFKQVQRRPFFINGQIASFLNGAPGGGLGGIIAPVVGALLANAAPADPTTPITQSFAGLADGALLDSQAGWTLQSKAGTSAGDLANARKIMGVKNGVLNLDPTLGNAYALLAFALHDPNTLDHAIDLDAVNAVTGNDYGFGVVLSYTDPNNYIYLRTTTFSGHAVYVNMVVNGTANESTIGSTDGAGFTPATSGHWRFAIVGRTLTVSQTDATGTHTGSIAIPAGFPKGALAGLTNCTFSNGFVQQLQNIRVGGSAAAPAPLVVTAAGIDPKRRATADLTYTSATADVYQIGVLSADGSTTLVAWEDAVVSANAAAGTATIRGQSTIPAATKGQAQVQVRRKAATGISATGVANVPTPFVLGMNGNGSGPAAVADMYRNRGLAARYTGILSGGANVDRYSDFALTADGYPAAIPAGYQQVNVLLWEGGANGRLGTWDITFPAGATGGWGGGAGNNTAGLNSSGATFDSANGKASITLNGKDVGNLFLYFTAPPSGGWGANGIKLTCLPRNDPKPAAMLADQFVADYGAAAGFGLWRFMKDSQVENDYGLWAEPRWFKPAIVGQFSAELGVAPWLNMPVSVTDAYATAYATALAASALPASATVYVAVGNEMWNAGYDRQYRYGMLRAAREGYVTGLAAGTVIDGFFTPAFDGSNKANRTFNSGDVVFTQGTNSGGSTGAMLVLKALRNTAVGASFDMSVSNADFQQLASWELLVPGMRKWHVARTIAVGNLFKAKLGSRCKVVLENWQLDAASDVVSYIGSQASAQAIDFFSPTDYFGVPYNYTDNAWFSTYASDPTGWVNKFIAMATADAATTVARLKAASTGIPAAMVTAWGQPTSGSFYPTISTYEGLGHEVIFQAGMPAGAAAAIGALMAQVKQDDRWRTQVIAPFVRQMAILGGPHAFFVSYEDYAFVNGGIQVQMFGCLANGDGTKRQTEMQYRGIADGVAAALA